MDRLTRLKETIKTHGLDGMIITGRPNTLYFSNFSGTTSYLLVTMNKSFLVVDFRYTIQARQQVFPGIEVVELTESFTTTLNTLINDNGVKLLGFEGNIMNYAEYSRFKEKLTSVTKWVDLGNEIGLLRIIKDADEVEAIRQAASLGDKIFDHILTVIKPGLREYEVAAEMEYQMKKLGCKGPSFETIVAAGVRSAMPHGTASEGIIKKGDAIVLDFGVIYHNYCSDMTRTIFVGEPDIELIKIYDIVKHAQQTALESIVSGMAASAADGVARDIIKNAGYGGCFGHSLGHGVGIEIHEEPRVSEKSTDTLLDGMVFTVEPGIYVDGLGGVRIEDMVVLEKGKPRVLTSSTKSMIIL